MKVCTRCRVKFRSGSCPKCRSSYYTSSPSSNTSYAEYAYVDSDSGRDSCNSDSGSYSYDSSSSDSSSPSCD